MPHTKVTNIRVLKTVALTFVSVFGVIWLLLEPLGGMIYIIEIRNQIFVFYVVLIIVSILISMIIINHRMYLRGMNGLKKKDDQCIEIGEDRSKFDYLSLLSKAKIKVDLLGLSLAPFSSEQYINLLYTLIKRDVEINCLLLNPLSPNLTQRDEELYTVNMDIRIATALTLRTLINLKKSCGVKERKRITIRVINVLPHYGLFRVDNIVLWNPYLVKKTGLGSPFFVVQENSIWGNALTTDFKELVEKYSFIIDSDTSFENLEAMLIKDKFIYDSYPDQKVVNKIKQFF